MNRNYKQPYVTQEWADSRQTDMAVAVAIHSIAGVKRTPEKIWDEPTQAEWEHIHMAVEEYVLHGDFEYDTNGYFFGCEKVYI